jgi:hypothetical protein
MRMWKIVVALVVMSMLSGFVLAVPTRSTPTVNQTASAPAANLEVVGHIGGQVSAIAMSGNFAYVGQQAEFAVLDITDPARPTRLGSLLFDDQNLISKIVLTGHYAVVAKYDGRVKMIDVADPTRLVVVGEIQVTDYLIDLAADAHYVYVLAGGATMTNGLRVIDISDPTSPVVVGYFPAVYYYSKMAVSGQYAFLYEDFGKIHTVDLADPTHPIKIGESPISGGWIWDMTALDHTVYVATESFDTDTGTLHVLDGTQPAALVEVGTVNLHDLGWGDGYYTDLSVADKRVYVAGSTFQIVDVADPTHPVWRSEYIGPTMGAYGSVSGNRAVVGTQGRGWRILDVTNAQHSIELGAYDPPSYAIAAAVSNTLVYVANGAYGLRVVDTTNIYNPAVLPVVPPGAADVVRVSGNTAYVLARPNEIRVLNVSNPANPITVKTYNFTGQLEDFEIAGQYAYVIDAAYGVHVYNITQPTAWSQVSSVPIPGAHDITVFGQRAYVLASYAGRELLYILLLTDPAHPVARWTWQASHGQLTDVWADDQLAYLTFGAESDTGLMIIDVSGPGVPQQVGERTVFSHGSIDPVVSVSVAGRLAYLTQPFSGLRVIDVSVSAQPIELEQHFTPGSTWNVIAAGNRAYVNTLYGGLSIYEQYGNAAGQLLDGAHLPLALLGVKISAGGDLSTTTNITGSFDLRSLPVGVNTVTPTLAGYTFMPPTVTIQTPSAYLGDLNFVALVAPMSITLTPGVTTTLTYTEPNGASIEAVFPADTLSQTTTITIVPTLADGGVDQWFTGHAFDLATPIGLWPDLDFNVPVTITIRYTDRDVSVVSDEVALQLAWWDGAQWIEAASTCSPTSIYVRDTTANILSVPICATGRYALFGPTHNVYLPTISR